MKTLKNIILTLFIVLLFSCDEKEKLSHNGFTIDAYIHSNTSKEAYLMNANGQIIDTASINNNKFQLLGNSESLQLHKISFNNLEFALPIWIQNKEKIDVYHSPIRTLVYGSETYDVLNKHAEMLEEFSNKKNKIATDFKEQDFTALQNKMDLISKKSLDYIFSELKDANKPVLHYFSETMDINQLNNTDLLRLSKAIEKTDYKDWISQVNTRIDTLNARKLKSEAIVTIDPAKVYVPYREPAPVFSGVSMQGNEISLQSVLQGKKAVLVDFWASWCKPCRMVTPQVRAMYNKYQNKGFDIITVSEDRNETAWRKGVAEDNMQSWNHILDSRMLIASRYGARAIPHMVLIDANGKIIKNKISINQLQQELKKIFN